MVKKRESNMAAKLTSQNRVSAVRRLRSWICVALVLSAWPARAQYPDVEINNDPGLTEQATKATPIELTAEEKAEREGRKACKAAICAAFHNRKPGDDIACTVLKSFRKEQLDKMLSKAKASWPWGKVTCSADVKLKRDVLTRALSDAKLEATLDTHQVLCTVERGTEPSAEIKADFAPKVTFEKGKAVKAQLNWGKLEAPTLVKAAMWPATATDNAVNVLGGMLVEDINDFIGPKCAEVKSDWEGR